jgi:DNA (cytosine-5)-methyltransferase 1
MPNELPCLIDLYSGVGGLSLGAARGGFEVRAAVDNDPIAVATHSKNFPNTKHSSCDLKRIKGSDLMELADLRKGQLDGLVGGPPCQGFSTMGRRDPKDKRNELFARFFRLVDEIQPKFFVAENVPGILDDEFTSIRKRAMRIVEDDYIVLDPIKIVAKDYGAPTLRARIFFIGYKPRYFRDLDPTLFGSDPQSVRVTVKEALEGLPGRIDASWQTECDGWRRVSDMEASRFADLVAGFIPDGIGDETAIDRYVSKREVSGCLGTRHESEVKERFARVRQGGVDPVSRAPRLDPDGYCPTLRAGTGKERGSFQSLRPIHPTANRVITPREAARLQGFPDWFVFHPTKWHSFRQIGNSVSPIVSQMLFETIASRLKG